MLNMKKSSDDEKRHKKKRKYNPYLKDKYTLSKINEYENYLANIEKLSKEQGFDI